MQSNSACDFIEDLYKKHFKLEYIDVARSINSDIKKRGAIKEVVIMNYTSRGLLRRSV